MGLAQSIPDPALIKDRAIRTVITAVRENIYELAGVNNEDAAAVTVQDMLNLGLFAKDTAGRVYNNVTAAPPPFNDEVLSAATAASAESVEYGAIDASSGLAVGTTSTGLLIPSAAIITNVWYDVLTEFTGADADTAISIGLEGDNEIYMPATKLTEQFHVNMKNPQAKVGTTGIHRTAVDGQVYNFPEKTTSSAYLALGVHNSALTAGEMNIFLTYVISQ